MIKIISTSALFFLLFLQNTFATPGLLFDVTATGTPANVSLTLCLNGKGILSCQNYTVSALNLTITSYTP